MPVFFIPLRITNLYEFTYMAQYLTKQNLLFPELSFQIVGCLFEVYNQLGYGYSEQIYQRAISQIFLAKGLQFREQVYIPILFNQQTIGRQYLDFLVEGKVVVELKQGRRFAKKHIDQLYQYLVSSNLQLGLLVYFAPDKLIYKRIINLPN